MLAPVSRHITAARRELRITLNKLTPRLTKLANAEEAHLAALKQLWALEGEISVLEQLLAHPSIDVLMKRRLEFKLAIQTSYITLDRTAEVYRTVHGELLAATEEANKFRGALEVLERLQRTSETLTVLTAGQAEALKRKLGQLGQSRRLLQGRAQGGRRVPPRAQA